VRVCRTCYAAGKDFRTALLTGSHAGALQAYSTGCVNLRVPCNPSDDNADEVCCVCPSVGGRCLGDSRTSCGSGGPLWLCDFYSARIYREYRPSRLVGKGGRSVARSQRSANARGEDGGRAHCCMPPRPLSPRLPGFERCNTLPAAFFNAPRLLSPVALKFRPGRKNVAARRVVILWG